MPIIIFLLCHWFLSLFCQTFFLHRYAAHRMFSMSPFWEKTFHFLTFLTQGSSYLNPRAYAIMHRMHHAFSDTEKDPHSPHFYANAVSMIWSTKNVYYNLLTNKVQAETEFESGYPEWQAFDRYADSWPARVLWGVFYSLFYIYFMPNPWFLLFLPVHYVIGPIQGAIVNWCGHKYGYRNFHNGDESRNTLVVDVLMLGELYQNNHHKNPNRSNFAWRWFEFDPGYFVIRLLHLARIIQIRPKIV